MLKGASRCLVRTLGTVSIGFGESMGFEPRTSEHGAGECGRVGEHTILCMGAAVPAGRRRCGRVSRTGWAVSRAEVSDSSRQMLVLDRQMMRKRHRSGDTPNSHRQTGTRKGTGRNHGWGQKAWLFIGNAMRQAGSVTGRQKNDGE